MKDELGRLWKEAEVAYFKLSQNLSGGGGGGLRKTTHLISGLEKFPKTLSFSNRESQVTLKPLKPKLV
jgi:hypothetical protein